MGSQWFALCLQPGLPRGRRSTSRRQMTAVSKPDDRKILKLKRGAGPEGGWADMAQAEICESGDGASVAEGRPTILMISANRSALESLFKLIWFRLGTQSF